ncbi:MAG: primosomal protein N', partial [SAR324 cluster bacterium]|nr:primosomal protein N' [SAR324 cluster bacterium]
MIAEVALNLPLRHAFDYLIPPEEAEWITPGCRVIVPFGKRLRAGIVVGTKAESALAPERLKAIHQAAEGGVLFPQDILTFTQWIARYYFCGWGEVLEAALPAGMRAKIRARLRFREWPPPEEILKGLSAKPLKLLRTHREWNADQWKRSGPTAADGQWLQKHLKPGGTLEIHYQYLGSEPHRPGQRWARLGEIPPPVPRRRRNPLRETRKEQALRLIREEGPLPLARLRALMPDPATVVRALARDGHVEMFEQPDSESGCGATAVAPEPFLQLTEPQQAAFDAIAGALAGGGYAAFLLDGVTGSGKTEVYLHAVREALNQGRGSLLLVPEIALTESIVNRFRARFGAEVAVLHSGLPEAKRFEEWRRIHDGTARVVIGARSAVFAPLHRLGLVVVDEEHDPSYKQDETPRYNGRDAAMMRARQSGAVVVLGSATPSLEATRNVAQGKLTRMVLPARVYDRPMPEVEILSLASEPRQPGSPLFTLRLVEAIRETLRNKEQAILFLNRRGFAHLVRCGACQQDLVCSNCSITLTYHQADQRLRCHRCNSTRQMPERCPTCGEPEIKAMGLGTQRIEQEVAVMFPEARTLRVDSDTLRKRGELERMMGAIQRREYDLIIGTQILSKGHDFPYITLVGAVLADVSLNLPDFRAAERTFQLLTQVAGRAGRGERPGRVLIQTYNPSHYSLVHVRNHDAAAFNERELAARTDSGSPPFSSQALVWVTGPVLGRVEKLARQVAGKLRERRPPAVEVLGPVTA